MSDRADKNNKYSSNAIIKVIGVGGGGGNALNTMIESGLTGVEFIAANTDVQALQSNLAPIKIQLGRELTKGLGAGANPEMGRNAALEDKAILQEVLSGSDMVFVTGGMGGGTGTGAAPIIAQVARELGALTVGVVTKPFTFEGKRRKQQSEHGIQALRQSVDTLITIPNQRLLSIAPPEMSMLEGFKLADEVLLNAVKGISDIINIPGRVNVDFADVKTIMSEMGMALMGIGTATGSNRAAEAARAAINSPLLEDIDIEGATGILINITGTSSMTLHEISEASTLIQEAAHEEANIIFGAVIDESMSDTIRVTVIATGFDQARVSFPDTAHGFANLPPQGQFIPQNVTNQNPQQAFAGMNSQRPQSGFTQNIPAVNPYEVRSPNQGIPQQQHSQSQFNQQQSAPNHFQRQQFGREHQPGFNNSGMNSQNTIANNRPINSHEINNSHTTQQTSNLFRNTNISNTEARSPITQNSASQSQSKVHENPMTSSWTNQHQNQQSQQNSKNENSSDLEELTKWTFDMANQQNAAHKSHETNKVMGASATKNEEHSQEDAAETALKLAKELSDIEIDDSDFETPAFMRRKDDSHRNA
ncbi:cell division protein FtsZ [Silvanigrella aquatica]|uniref:Cell division protein FtsZ n=1 Tax=Silvanigrella aquatica TaxID=1915309 RepID=A0A1L4CWY0_9BACT|nr:cell division protein FtsZ [Silvanigrella aquatica]APJ02455.1 cell division protein FtsZ [Silvanigrella aquatica]